MQSVGYTINPFIAKTFANLDLPITPIKIHMTESGSLWYRHNDCVHQRSELDFTENTYGTVARVELTYFLKVLNKRRHTFNT